MALRKQQAVLDRLPYHFILIEICGGVTRVALLLPRSQLAPRRTQVAVGQRDLNLGAPMTELAKAEREKQHADIDDEAKQPVDGYRNRIDRTDDQREPDHDQ